MTRPQRASVPCKGRFVMRWSRPWLIWSIPVRLVSSNWQALRARIYAKPLQYIVSYRVLWEYPDPPQKVYRVGVEAEIPVQ